MKRERGPVALGVLILVAAVAGAFTGKAVAQTPQPVRDGTAKLVGPYNPHAMLRLVFGLQPPHLAEERQFVRELQTKGSPQFHAFLAPEEWRARFAPSAEDEQAVVDWAQAQGLVVTRHYPNRLLVDVEAPVATIERALGVAINSYKLGDTSFFSNERDPIIPAELTGVIHSVEGLNSLQVLRPAGSSARAFSFPPYSPGPVASPGRSMHANGDFTRLSDALKEGHSDRPKHDITNGAYDPTDIYSSEAYDYNALYALGHCCNPTGNSGSSPPDSSIAIATSGDLNFSDIAGFQSQYPYLAYNIQTIYIDGTPPCCNVETTLDAEWSTATSNSFGSYIDTAKIWSYEGANTLKSTFTDVYNQILTDGNARVFSTSWGCAELYCYDTGTMDTDDAVFYEMTGEGWTLVAAAGDQGATTGCGPYDAVSFPASDSNIVAAGGTTMSLSSGPIFNYEVAWSGGPYGCASNDGGSGGGVSAYWPIPPYQTGGTFRSLPDMALNADWYNTPQNIYFNGALSGNGGTSIVAPEIAGFFAQANAYLLALGNVCGPQGTSGCAPIGNANINLYEEGMLGYTPHYPFYDITSGCNDNDITQYYGLSYYCAGLGYDMVTGWGSANMLQLAWAFTTYFAFDYGAPVASFSGPPTNQWYNTDQTVSWTVSDTSNNGRPPNGVAGFSAGWDSDPGDPYSEPTPGEGNSFYSGPQFPNGTSGSLGLANAGSQGCHTVNLRAWDNSGYGSGDLTYGPLCYDTIPPTTAESQSPLPNGAGWNNTTVQVTLTASDPGSGSGTGSGVLVTYYAVDNSACTPANLAACAAYGGPFSIATQARHNVYFFSEDKAGNLGSLQASGVNIDETPPYTTATVTGTTSVQVTLTATDNLSGVAITVYQIDGGGVKTYTQPFTVSTVGSHTVTFHSVDNAGNVENAESTTFRVLAHLAGAPTLTTDFFGDGKGDVGVWRPSNGTWYIQSNNGGSTLAQVQGESGDVPVAGDYDGDGKDDFAVWRPSTGTWYIIPSSDPASPETIAWGSPDDVPVPADYDGDGITDIAVWRPSTGTFYVSLSSSGKTVSEQWGLPGDVPVTGDYDGDGKADYAVFRPSNGTWYVIESSTGKIVTTAFGLPGDIPVEGDYDGDGETDLAVWRSSTAIFYVLYSSTGETVSQPWGLLGDVPVIGDYDGDQKNDYGVWRPSTGYWYIRNSSNGTMTAKAWGVAGDVPASHLASIFRRDKHIANYDGDRKTDIGVWRPSTGTYYVIDSSTGRSVTQAWGENGDEIVPGDYDGDGKTDYAVWRPSTGTWYVLYSSSKKTVSQQLGLDGDIPVPGDYDGDGKTDYAVWRPSTGTYYVMLSSMGKTVTHAWGESGDIPTPADYDGDGKTDYAIWRPSTGTWYVLYSSTNKTVSKQWGLSGDIPVPGDYDGDGKTDYAVWRPSNGTYYVILSSTGKSVTQPWGENGDIPVAKDYDGDEKTDYAVWRPSTATWYILQSSNGKTIATKWGLATDVPVNKPTGQ